MSDQGSHPPDSSAQPWRPAAPQPVPRAVPHPHAAPTPATRAVPHSEEHHSQHSSSHASETCSAEQSPSPVPTLAPAAASRRTPAPRTDEHTPVCRVVIADDNPAERAGLAGILDAPGDIAIVAEVADAAQACDAAARYAPDVVLLDVRTPAGDSLVTLTELVRLAPVLLLTYDRDSEIVQQALRLGALGYLVHGNFADHELLAAVRAVRDTPDSVAPGPVDTTRPGAAPTLSAYVAHGQGRES